jgi:hypothetical protein
MLISIVLADFIEAYQMLILLITLKLNVGRNPEALSGRAIL